MKLKGLYSLAAIVMLATIMESCMREDAVTLTLPENCNVEFSAILKDSYKVKTRTLDTLYVASSPFSGNFYIELFTDTPAPGESQSLIATYKVPSGYEGILAPINEENQLEWQTLEGNHTFYSWTMPWYDGYSAADETDDNFESTTWTNATEVSTDPVEIYFHDSPEGPGGYDIYKNNAIYSTFIGAVSGPYSYVGHGKYVDFTFRHLVSKININMLAIVKPDNSYNKDVVGDITFIGMPETATFYPHPDDGSAPYVEPGELNQNEGLTFFINNIDQGTGSRNELYIAPEIDFSNIGFKINLNNLDYGQEGDYYGNFNDVVFVREGEDFDDVNGRDSKILHAGEMMTLNFQLLPGQGPGVSVIIKNWDTESQHSAVNHPYQGIYTDEEFGDLINMFGKYNPPSNYYPNIPEEMMEYFELYGITIEDDQLVFPLYDNVNIDASVVSIFKSFIIDGQGHQLVMKTNRNQTFGGTPYYNIGPVRDIYITDPDGNNSIYIDSDGFVYTFDQTTQDFVKTTHQLLPLEDGKYSYDINPQTGEIIQSDFYTF